MTGILVLHHCFQTLLTLLVQKALFFEAYAIPSLLTAVFLTSWSFTRSGKTLGAPMSHLRLHSNNFQQLPCLDIDTDLTDINSSSLHSLTSQTLVFLISRDLLHLFFSAADSHGHHMDLISHKLRSLKGQVLSWGLLAHLLKCARWPSAFTCWRPAVSQLYPPRILSCLLNQIRLHSPSFHFSQHPCPALPTPSLTPVW